MGPNLQLHCNHGAPSAEDTHYSLVKSESLALTPHTRIGLWVAARAQSTESWISLLLPD